MALGFLVAPFDVEAGQCGRCDGGACDGVCASTEFANCSDLASCADCCPGACGDFICETDPSKVENDPNSPDCCAEDCCDAVNCDDFCSGGGSCGTPACEAPEECGICPECEDDPACDGGPGCDFDDICEPANGETPCDCAEDCAPTQGTCGDGCCYPGGPENPCNCAQDCPGGSGSCGDECCDQDGGESVEDCPQDCGTCNEDLCCDLNAGESSASCVTDCGECGDLVCNPPLENSEECEDCYCGDFICDTGESNQSCPEDCINGSHCGDGECEEGDEFCDQDCLCVGITSCDDCDDANVCTTDSCEELVCQHEPVNCDDGNACNGAETCNPVSGCGPGLPLSCDDGNACNGVETCDPLAGCQPGSPVDCDDGLDCTIDSCNSQTGNCSNVPKTPEECGDDGDPCTGTIQCNLATGQCEPIVPPPNCDDGLDCTIDSCDSQTGNCSNVPMTPEECGDDGDPCTGTIQCNLATGQCEPIVPPPDCDDGLDCTIDSCNSQTGNCSNVPMTPEECGDDGEPCNGFIACNLATGQCEQIVPPPNCDDNAPCTIDSCDDDTGNCVHEPKDCGDDGDPCNGAELCDNATGECTVIGLPDCDDGLDCTIDSCNSQTGNCSNVPMTPEECGDDGEPCNGFIACNLATGQCEQIVPPPDCDDNDPCTADSCDSVTGNCVHDPISNCGEACSTDFTGLPATTCPDDPAGPVKTMTALQAYLAGPQTTNLKVAKHKSGGSYNFAGADLTIDTDCRVEFVKDSTFFNVGDIAITASEIVIRNNIQTASDTSMTLRAGGSVEIKQASSIANRNVVVESPTILYRGDLRMGGTAALCGDNIEMTAGSLMRDMEEVFMHSTNSLVLRGDMRAVGAVRLRSDNSIELKLANMIGSFSQPVGTVTIEATNTFIDRGDIRASESVNITTNILQLFGAHFFNVAGGAPNTCNLTFVANTGPDPTTNGICNPGVD